MARRRLLTAGQWTAFLGIPEDERELVRHYTLGRNNYLFAGSDVGGDRAASMYTIVQTAKLNGVNPEAYLRDTLAKIAEGHPISRLDELMPWKWGPAVTSES